MSLLFNGWKKLSLLFIMALILQAIYMLPVANAEPDWTGYTPITSKEDLDNIRNNLLGKYYLTADIVFTSDDFTSGGAFYNGGAGWNPIGTDSTKTFKGVFDGNGHTISGLHCTVSSSSANVFAGLFGYNQGTIQNVGMIDDSIQATSGAAYKSYAGGIAGVNYTGAYTGAIINCYHTGNVTASSSYYSYAGGIVGYNQSASISNGYNAGNINASSSSSSKDIKAYAGGIAGYNDYTGTIKNYYNTGHIEAFSSGSSSSYYPYAYAGGITAGNNSSSVINNCFNNGNIDALTSCTHNYGNTYAGGIAGINSSSRINSSYNVSNVRASKALSTYSGEIAGSSDSNSTIETCFYFDKSAGADNNATALSYEQMKNQVSFAGFDFTNIWTINSDSAYPFPTLKNFGYIDKEENTVDFDGGNGMLLSPYKIANKEQLSRIREYNGCFFLLTVDIVFVPDDFTSSGAFYNGGAGWNPIGSIAESPFLGSFNGNGHTISGLVCNVTSSTTDVYAGLFGDNQGTIQNLGMIDANIQAVSASDYYSYAGGIVGRNVGNISNCNDTGRIQSSSYAGGIAGYDYSGTIINCNNSGDINSSLYAGGITGYTAATATIRNCYNTGSVSAGRYAGGIVGNNNSGTISNCYNIADVNSSGFSGGISAYNDNYSAISDCYNAGIVNSTTPSSSNDAYTGGIVGDNINYSTISNCYNIGTVNSEGSAYTLCGGIAGHNSSYATNAIRNCYYLNSISRGTNGGGTVALSFEQMKSQASFTGLDFANTWTMNGDAYYPFPVFIHVALGNKQENTVDFDGGNGTLLNPFLISNKTQLNQIRNFRGAQFKLTSDIVFSKAEFAIGGDFYNGGMGWHPIGGSIANTFFGMLDGNGHTVSGLVCNITSSTADVYAGLFGYNQGTVQNLNMIDYDISAVATSSYAAYAGGISGYASGTISACHSTGNTNAMSSSKDAYAGGISGYASGNVNTCYNTGDVTATSSSYYAYVGGIAGSSGTISKCYNTGNVNAGKSSTAYAGGISGNNSGAITNCYNTGNVNTTGTSYAIAGGITGYDSGTISNCYNTADIKASPNVGGIAGYKYSNGNISNCYYLNTISKGVGGGTDSTTVRSMDQMKLQSSYTGFDFSNTWQQDVFLPYLRSVPYVNLDSIVFLEKNIQIAAGAICQTKLQVTPVNTTFVDAQYTSLDPSIAAVAQNGVITAIKTGIVNIVVQDSITNKASICTVTVVPGVTGISIGGSMNTIKTGDVIQLSATVLPVNADNKTVSWSSSNTSIATVDQTGLVSALMSGSVTIYAASNDGTNIKGLYNITVNQPAQSVSLNTKTLQLKNGETQSLIANVLPANATNKSVIWTTSNAAVATADITGKITGKSKGTAIITCKTEDGNYTDTCTVVVIQQVTGVSLAQTSVNIGLGGHLQLIPVIIPANADNQNVSWNSSDPCVSVSGDGTISGDSEGTSVITVTSQDGSQDGKKSAMCIVYVGKAVTDISLNKGAATLIEGQSESLCITGILPTDAINQTVVWSSSDSSIALVDASGKVTAINPGTATISAEAADGSGVAAYCSVTVEPISVIKADIIAMPAKLVYDEMSEFDSTGMVLRLTYNDNSTVNVTSGWTTSYDFSVSGSRVVVVHYGDVSAQLNVTVNPFTITFVSCGSTVDSKTADFNTQIAAPDDPSKTGYAFAGWYPTSDCDTEAITFPCNVTGNITLYARWAINTYKVTFDSQGGSAISAAQVDYNAIITAPAEPKKTGYTFIGWYLPTSDTAEVTFPYTVTGDITLYAKWTTSIYDVLFNSRGGSVVENQSAKHNAMIIKPGDPTRDGYTFGGWYMDTDSTMEYDFATPVTASFMLYAKWTVNTYVVTFDSQSGSNITGKSADFNSKIIEPTKPSKANYTFSGWYKEASCINAWVFSADTIPAHDITLYAKWTLNYYNISYNAQGGSAVEDTKAEYGSKIMAPINPTMTSYIFSGWYKDVTCTTVWDFATDLVTQDTTLFAKWTAVIPVGIHCTKTDVTTYGGSDGSIPVTASGGNSGSYQYSINGGAWQSSNVFGGLGAGTYTVTACDAGNVNNVATTSISIGQPSYMGSFPANKIPAKATAGYALKLTPQKAPAGFMLQSVSFLSSNRAAAAVDPNGDVTFLAGGKATVTITMVFQKVDSKGKVTMKRVILKKAMTVLQPVSSITFSQPGYSVLRSKSIMLSPITTIAPKTASNKKVKWTSSNTRVASVSSSGIVLGKAAGTVTITCVALDGSGASDSCTVTVMPISTQSIKLSTTMLTVKKGATYTLKATVSPSNSDFKKVIWASSDPTIASVDIKTGKIKGVAPGTVTVTATTADGKSTSCTVTIK